MIDLWSIPLEASRTGLAAARALLDADERSASRRFEKRSLANAFVLRRAARRAILARYLNVLPERIAFQENRHGRPQTDGLRFSASHSGAMACLAVTRGDVVGADIERIRPVDTLLFEQRILSPDERQMLQEQPEPDRLNRLLTLWTAKEAILKAMGTGLCLEMLPRITVPPETGCWRQATAPGGAWQVRSTVDGDYVTSLAAPAPDAVTHRDATALLHGHGVG
ncbi:MAG: 4'-phosphopantetheinyl transferase superfamily protein [Paracoccaceae bacterium]|nr:4'-phosphopantetheinyl transferase superfamily protein [Paracoccaceae bacterium]